MTYLFHVKLFRSMRYHTGVGIGCGVLLMAAPAVWADVHKCTSSDGRVIFSDQPCPVGQVGGKTKHGVVTPAAEAPPASPKDLSAQSREDMRVRMRAALSPECRVLSDKVNRYVAQGTSQTPEAVVKADMARFEKQCAKQTEAAMQAEMERKAADRKLLEAQQACQEKRRVVHARRGQRANLSGPDQRALSDLESEVARDCR
jgi:hypothetical protein